MPAAYSVRHPHPVPSHGALRSRTTTADLYGGDPFEDVGQDNTIARGEVECFTARQVWVTLRDRTTAFEQMAVRGTCFRPHPSQFEEA